MNIQVCAHMRFMQHNSQVQEVEIADERETYGPTHPGLVGRAQYIFKKYGGPKPGEGVWGPASRGRACVRGRGRGRGGSTEEPVGGPIRVGRVTRCGQMWMWTCSRLISVSCLHLQTQMKY